MDVIIDHLMLQISSFFTAIHLVNSVLQCTRSAYSSSWGEAAFLFSTKFHHHRLHHLRRAACQVRRRSVSYNTISCFMLAKYRKQTSSPRMVTLCCHLAIHSFLNPSIRLWLVEHSMWKPVLLLIRGTVSGVGSDGPLSHLLDRKSVV